MVDKRRNDDSNKGANKRKGLLELSIFCAAIAAGTACSISSKVLYELKGVGSDGTLQTFDKPLAQTLGMFVAMVFGLPIHWMIVAFRIPFPGYEQFQSKKENDNTTDDDDELERLLSRWSRDDDDDNDNDSPTTNNAAVTTRVPLYIYFMLAIPAIFDLVTTALCNTGLVYLDVSIYQLLRGSGIIFTALIRTWALQQPLFKFQWVGVGFNVASIVLVGMSALLQSKSSPEEGNFQQVVFAIIIMLLGTLVQSMQFVFEEKVMVNDEIKVPPLLLFGMEGVWCVHV
jgi:drug/metabolite transporter (DMT)-like permease